MSKFDLFANFLQKEYNIDIKKAGLVPPRPGLKWNPVVHRWVSEESAQPPKRNRPMTLYERMRLGKSMKKGSPKPKRPGEGKFTGWTEVKEPPLPSGLFRTAPKLTALNTGASLRNLSAKLPKMTSPKFPKALNSFEGKKDTLRNKMIGQSQSQAFKKATPKLGTGTRFKNLARKLAVVGKK